jgi:hypothetical protein
MESISDDETLLLFWSTQVTAVPLFPPHHDFPFVSDELWWWWFTVSLVGVTDTGLSLCIWGHRFHGKQASNDHNNQNAIHHILSHHHHNSNVCWRGSPECQLRHMFFKPGLFTMCNYGGASVILLELKKMLGSWFFIVSLLHR